MRSDSYARGERTGRVVTNFGHQEMVYDPDPPAKQAPQETTESMMIVALRRRHDGWTADRQRLFLNTLANTGSISTAADAADITPRSAYRLRNHPKGEAFARAWDAALMRAGGRLMAIAFERATSGTPRQIWREGRIIAEQAIPSDRVLMFLLRHLNPALFDAGGDMAARTAAIAAMQADFAPAMTGLIDTDVDADLLDIDDYRPHPPAKDRA